MYLLKKLNYNPEYIMRRIDKEESLLNGKTPFVYQRSSGRIYFVQIDVVRFGISSNGKTRKCMHCVWLQQTETGFSKTYFIRR